MLVTLFALAIEGYRRYYVPPLDKIHGLEIVSEGKRGYYLLLDEQATRKTVDHLVANLEVDMMLCFYDSNYDSPSDPGAYVYVLKSPKGYVAKLGNHGWSTSWFPIEEVEAGDYLWACRKDNGPDRNVDWLGNGMSLYARSEQPSQINEDRDYDAYRFIRSRIAEPSGENEH